MRYSRLSSRASSLPFAAVVALAGALAVGTVASLAAASPQTPAASPPAAAPTTPASAPPAARPSAPPATTPPATTPPASPTKPSLSPAGPGKLAAPGSGADVRTPVVPTDLAYVLLTTSMGEVLLELDRSNAPISVDNFLRYVDSGFYNRTTFHRVVSNFVIQGGGFTETMEQKKTDAPIKNEWQNGLKNVRGTVSMARLPAPDSATSQFFINVADNTALDGPRGGAGYAVFGTVVKGMDVVDKIRAVPVASRPATPPATGVMSDVPVTNVVIIAATKVSAVEAKKMMEAPAPASAPAAK